MHVEIDGIGGIVVIDEEIEVVEVGVIDAAGTGFDEIVVVDIEFALVELLLLMLDLVELSL